MRKKSEHDPNSQRAKPRRLFSFDSVRSAGSAPRRDSSDHERPQQPVLASKTLTNVREDDDNEERSFFPEKPSRFVAEPESLSTSSTPSETASSSTKLRPIRPVPLASTKSYTADATASTPTPTRARWENLRHHVLPSPSSRPSTPPHRTASPQPTLDPHSRSTTPKPSRRGRLGFKQVVEHAWTTNKEIVAQTNKFADAILRASLPGYGPAMNNMNRRFDNLKRPQSILSLSAPSLSSIPSDAPTLSSLYQLLVHHSGMVSEKEMSISPYLPHESHVLSTLMAPFIFPLKYFGARLEEERLIAIETFEILFRSWTVQDETGIVERCLWCTKVAASLSSGPLRSRVLASLWRLLVPGDRGRTSLSPLSFHSISSGLFSLLSSFHMTAVTQQQSPFGPTPPPGLHQISHPDIQSAQDLISQFLSGSLGDLDEGSLEEEYATELSARDKRQAGLLRQAVFLIGLANSFEFSLATLPWMLNNLVEEYWPVLPSEPLTSTYATICARKISTVCRVAISFLQPFLPKNETPSPHPISRGPSSESADLAFGPPASNISTIQRFIKLFQTRVIPEAEVLDSGVSMDSVVVGEARRGVVDFLLDLICLEWEGEVAKNHREDVFGPAIESSKEIVHWAAGTLSKWYSGRVDNPWKVAVEKTFQQLVSGEWDRKVRVLSAILKSFPDAVRKSIFSAAFLTLNDQLVDNPPPYPFPALSSFLTSLSKVCPPIFFKPLFACAASDKEFTIVNHLCTLRAHAKYVSDYWLRDVDMMCFALLGDASKASQSGERGSRLGQLILLVELTSQIQAVRHAKEGTGSEGGHAPIAKFASGLENKLALLIEAKEKVNPLPFSHRLLLSVLFREFRLLTRSLRPAPWLSRTLSWFFEYCDEDAIDEAEQEVSDTVERINGLYAAAQTGVGHGHKHHTSMLAAMSPKPQLLEGNEDTKQLDLAATFNENRKFIDSLSRGFPPRVLKLFVTMSVLIRDEDYQQLGQILWANFLMDNADPSLTASTCFLIMHCAEKVPLDLLANIEVDLRASDEATRLEAVHKTSILINWRFQIISQNFVNDRNHRPFRLARPPLPFLALDLGTSLYVNTEDVNENREKDEVPLELKKRLAELGWAEENAGVVDPWQEWLTTPLSLLPTNQIDRLEANAADPLGATSPLGSPNPSPRKGKLDRDHLQTRQQQEDVSSLLRRNSSSGGPANAVKRRAVFVPPLSSIFVRLISLVKDPSCVVAAAARSTVMDLMRNDPGLLTRPIFDCLSGEQKDVRGAVAAFNALLHSHKTLPPPLTHIIFNNLAGFLKVASKDMEASGSFDDFGQVLPVMAHFATQVSQMSLREIRRAKIDHLLIPSGALWFPSSNPKGPMFPRAAEPTNPFDPFPHQLASISMIRTAQNMFFATMLKRNYQDVHAIRKHMERLILPSLSDDLFVRPLEGQDFIPGKESPFVATPSSATIRNLSLMLSRSYILLVAQIFRSMSRHSNDRQELGVLIDGLNRTLLIHGSEIVILSQVLIALMVASARFRRLFSSGGGYTLFMPTLVKIYAENPTHPGIRPAIEYAASRFYALHKESFLFQSLDAIGQVAILPGVDGTLFAEVYGLFSSLRRVSQSSADIAGIKDANKSQEREALILDTAERKPQTFLSAIRKVETQSGMQMTFQLPEEYENVGMRMDDFVKLFLTVIAHDPTISRAAHFLRVFRYLTPRLYKSQDVRKTLSDGIVALGVILLKASYKSRAQDVGAKHRAPEEDPNVLSEEGLDLLTPKKSLLPLDIKTLRLDYLQLVLSYEKTGGQIPLSAAIQVLEILKVLLRDWDEPKYDQFASFINEFVKALLIRDEPPQVKSVVSFLHELSPLLHAYMSTLDCTQVFEVVLQLCKQPMYAHDKSFAYTVVNELCTAGLVACDLAISENMLLTLKPRLVLVNLFAEAISLPTVDIIAELEKRQPTYLFLAGVILPLTLVLKTESQLISDATETQETRKAHQAAWARLLQYCMNACQHSRKDGDQQKSRLGSFRRGGEKDGNEASFWRTYLSTLVMALQVIKIIVVRGESEIVLPQLAVWERLGAFLRQMLTSGNAEFAFLTDIHSNFTTPAGSPRNSLQIHSFNSRPKLVVSTADIAGSRPTSPTQLASRPRLVDYALWSTLEFICAYRSPLRMQLKLFTMEKLLSLDRELRQGGLNRVLSPFSNSSSSRRVSTAIFSKSRRRASGLPNAPSSSPSSTPFLAPAPSQPKLNTSSSLLDSSNRRPGYALSPISPQVGHPNIPKIVHLGPASPTLGANPMFGSSMLPGGFRMDDTSGGKATKIRSMNLVHKTYNRIRGVQAFMGYTSLLPLPGPATPHPDQEVTIESWSKVQALQEITWETSELLVEFEEAAKPGVEDILVTGAQDDTPTTPFSVTSFPFPT